MGFQLPYLLLLLLALPILVWQYRRRMVAGSARAYALHPNLGQLSQVASATPAWKRHLSAGLYLLALTLGILALARPHATVPQPDDRAGVMLAIDISRSMRAEDIDPDRFTAAKKAAQTFVRALPEGAKVGLVSFAGYATLEVPLTTDHQRVFDQIDFLQMARGTAIGDGLLESLNAFPKNEAGKLLGPSTVVLLSDGRSNRGSDPLEAAQKAKEMGVIVHTIGLGRRSDQSQNDFQFNFMAFDEETLRSIAEATGGKYYAAESAQELQAAYRNLGRVVGWKPERTEVSGLFTLLAGLLLASSLVVSSVRRQVV
jgi:Ca-activated chloride channel family protein